MSTTRHRHAEAPRFRPAPPPSPNTDLFYDPVLRLGIGWLDAPRDAAVDVPARDSMALAQAVAGIVGVAAERARSTGDLPALRDAIEHALRPPDVEIGEDPREAALPTPPPIQDADVPSEGDRLRALMRRQATT